MPLRRGRVNSRAIFWGYHTMGMFALFRRKPHERSGFLLYGAAVAAAREPWFYSTLAVPDTLDGRFDVVGLHVALLVRRLRQDPAPEGAVLAQAVFDAMFGDMDQNLRQMGVGDLSVGKKVKAMWNAWHGRARAYEAALDGGDEAALALALHRNLWREAPDGEVARPEAVLAAGHVAAVARALAGQGLDVLRTGVVRFPSPEQANA